jgi:hypothetical protein
MILAIVLIAQVTTTTPANPCADELAILCQMSPYFCPSAYPPGLVPGTNGIPCWPGREVVPVRSQTRQTANLGRVPVRNNSTVLNQNADSVTEPASTSFRERLFRGIDLLRSARAAR